MIFLSIFFRPANIVIVLLQMLKVMFSLAPMSILCQFTIKLHSAIIMHSFNQVRKR